MQRVVVTESPEETAALGRRLGATLAARDFVGLSGQLGAGKTLFSRGVAQGLGVPLDDVTSPTYAIVQSYSGRLSLHHADFYRLTGEDDLFTTGFFDLLESDGAWLVEWVDQVPNAAPGDSLHVTLEVLDAQRRRITAVGRGPVSDALLMRWLP